MKQNPPPPENPFISLAVNIVLPVVVLNKGGQYFDAKTTLLIALCFPLIYGAQDWIRRRHKNYVSLLGLFNILVTGGLALKGLTGMWFAVKEAALPLMLGLLVLGSAWTKSPAAKILFCNPHVLNMTLIEERLAALAREMEYRKVLRKTTFWLSISFFISAAANFALAVIVFTDIDSALPSEEQMKILNSQLAHMTWMAFAVIALPLMVFSGFLIYFFLRRVSSLTEIPVDSLMKS